MEKNENRKAVNQTRKENGLNDAQTAQVTGGTLIKINDDTTPTTDPDKDNQ